MKKAYHCKSCGFVSTRNGEFLSINKVCFCKDCVESYKAKEMPEYRWVKQALKRR